MSGSRSIRVAVITTREQLDQKWLRQLALDPQVSSLERSAEPAAAFELVRRGQPHVVIVDRPVAEAEALIRQISAALSGTACVAVALPAEPQALRRLMLAGASDVVMRPVRAPELLDSIREAAQIAQTSRVQSPAAEGQAPGRGAFVATIAPKGGATF